MENKDEIKTEITQHDLDTAIYILKTYFQMVKERKRGKGVHIVFEFKSTGCGSLTYDETEPPIRWGMSSTAGERLFSLLQSDKELAFKAYRAQFQHPLDFAVFSSVYDFIKTRAQ